MNSLSSLAMWGFFLFQSCCTIGQLIGLSSSPLYAPIDKIRKFAGGSSRGLGLCILTLGSCVVTSMLPSMLMSVVVEMAPLETWNPSEMLLTTFSSLIYHFMVESSHGPIIERTLFWPGWIDSLSPMIGTPNSPLQSKAQSPPHVLITHLSS